MTLAVVGAGFGRTGTASLKEALEHLGLGPCYHMAEVEKHPEHGPLWHAALRGESVDWPALLGGYKAAVDWPAAHFWLELMHEYPESRVVLTVRDPQAWHRSMTHTIFEAVSRDSTERMADDLIFNHVFPEGIEDEDYVIEVFNRNTRSVCQTVPAGRLLVYEVSEGWAPLCEFLGVAVPETPFPRRNDTAAFREWLARSG